MDESKRFWGFLAFLFWPWMVVLTPIAVTVVLVLRMMGRLESWGPWYAAGARCVFLILAAPFLLIDVAVRSRQWKLAVALILLLPVMIACLGSLVIPEPSWQPDSGVTSAQAPSLHHLFGTNGDGVDMLALIIHGCRNSYVVVTTALAVILIFGIALGVVTGRYRWGRYVQAIAASLDTLPLLFGMMIVAALASLWVGKLLQQGLIAAQWQSSLRSLIIGLGIGAWLVSPMANLVADKIAFFRSQDFIDASISSGVPLSRVIWYHVVYRNAFAEIAILATHLAGLALLFEVSLGYLFSIGTAQLGRGFYHSLAQLLTTPEAKQAVLFFDSWWLFVAPTVFIVSAIVGFSMAGDGLGGLIRTTSAARGDTPLLFDRLLNDTGSREATHG